MSIFEGKTLMITGGTGSFGHAVLNRFLDTDIKEIRIFSRDEKKQDDMRHDYEARYPDQVGKSSFVSVMFVIYSLLKMPFMGLTIYSMQQHLNRCRPVNFSLWKQ